MGRIIGLKTREIIFNKQNGKCAICGKDFILTKPNRDCYFNKEVMQVDHIIPQSLGGNNKIENLRGLCCSCNASRNNKIGIEAANVIKRHINRTPIETFIKRIKDDLNIGILDRNQLNDIKVDLVLDLKNIIRSIEKI